MPRKKRSDATKILLLFAAIVALMVVFDYRENIANWWWYRGYSTNCEGRPKQFDNFGVAMPKGYAVHGLDVSHFTCPIDWFDVRRTKYADINLKFAITRATSGTKSIDEQFDANWAGIRRVGLIRGAYHYFKPGQSAVSQAAKYLSKAMPERGDLPPILDIEETGSLTDTQMDAAIKQWLKYTEKATRLRPIIYVNRHYFERFIRGRFDAYPVWIAAYKIPEDKLPDGLVWQFWQHTDKGHINGVSEYIDLNVFNGTLPQLRAILKK